MSVKMHRVAALGLAVLAGCAFKPIAQTEYNMGVEAFRIRDYANARQHWAHAVDEHDIRAYNNLGFVLYHGLGGPADVPRAVALWTDAAHAGDAESQWHLGQAHEAGKGVGRSTTEAYAWYRCAVADAQSKRAGDDLQDQIARSATQSLARLSPKLTPAQREAGEALAHSLIAAYVKHGADANENP